MKRNAIIATLSLASAVSANASPVVQGEPSIPSTVTTNANGHVVFDFGQHEFGWLEVNVQTTGKYDLVWGELLDNSGSIQTNALYTRQQGTIRCARTSIELAEKGWTRIPYETGGCNALNPRDASGFGRVMPFRWAEIVASPSGISAAEIRQVPIYYPYDMTESSFACDSSALERVYGFCKHSIRSTTYMGMFIDGDRERLPYEGDSFITQLSTYAITADDTLVRRTIEHLSTHTTWPTEWKQFFICMVYEDWMHSGKTDLVRRYWPLMRDIKSWRFLRRADGLLSTPGERNQPSPDGKFFRDIADWAKCYRDGFVFTPVNVIVNALHYRNLRDLEAMARAIGETRDADMFAKEAAQTFTSFQSIFFDSTNGRYRDGIDTNHATVQGNAMALACGAVPEENISSVAAYVASKGFSCSTYMAQFVLDALFKSGRADDALRLMSGDGPRSWIAMMNCGATITMEFWDLTLRERGRIPDMNHAWSTAPLNMISRFVLGVSPAKPGFEEIAIKPQPGFLQQLSGTVPTPKGAVSLAMQRNGQTWCIEVSTPCQSMFSFAGKNIPFSAGKYQLTLDLDK